MIYVTKTIQTYHSVNLIGLKGQVLKTHTFKTRDEALDYWVWALVNLEKLARVNRYKVAEISDVFQSLKNGELVNGCR